jgi:DNA-directed RNA polymerase II subunit RPB3
MSFQDLKAINAHKIQFTIKGVDLAYVNSVRRIVLAEIPCAAFFFDSYNSEGNDIKIDANTCALHNEFLGHRISLVPLHFDENETANFAQLNYKFILTKKNTTTSVVNVTTKDFKILDAENNDLGEQFREKIFPKNDITKDYILLTKLKPNLYDTMNGEEVDINCVASIGIAKTHARWSCVSQCSYENSIDEKLAAATLAKKIEECKSLQKDVEQVKSKFETLEKYRCYKKNEYDEPNEFIFYIESECRLRPTYLFYKGLSILIEKLRTFQKNLDESDDVAIKQVGTIDNYFQIEIRKEDHTLVNTLQSGIYNKAIRANVSNADLEYIGYSQPHPLDQLMYLKLKFRADDAKSVEDVKAFTQKFVQLIVEDLQRLRNEWKVFSKLDKSDIIEIKQTE